MIRSDLFCLDHEALQVTEARPLFDFRAFVRACRCHQWAKNLLLFAPLFAGQAWQWSLWRPVILAFVLFCLTASAIYLINDILDVEHDRSHPIKRHRPIASGRLSIGAAIFASLVMVSVGVGGAMLLVNQWFVVTLLGYAVLSIAYSFQLKKVVVLDVATLSLLYGIRVLAGGMASGLLVSQWLLMFSLFAFTSLAFLKRHAELFRLQLESNQSIDNPPNQESPGQVSGRGYRVGDLPSIASMGTASGYAAVLVLALYINSPAMQRLYGNAWSLWVFSAIVLFWFSRLWFLAGRGMVDEDPVSFALKDKTSVLCLLSGAVVLWLASFG